MCTSHFRSPVLRDKGQLLVYFHIRMLADNDLKSIENTQSLSKKRLRSINPKCAGYKSLYMKKHNYLKCAYTNYAYKF